MSNEPNMVQPIINPVISQNVKDAIKHFYNLYLLYLTNQQKIHNSLQSASPPLSVKEKRKYFKKHSKCIICKKIGKTIIKSEYNNEDGHRHLIARCGVVNETPCALNIDIKLGNTQSVNVLLDQIVLEYNILKCNIIKDKNNLVFGLDSEDEVLTRFAEYTQAVERIEHMIKQYTDHRDYFYNNLSSSTIIAELTEHISEIKSTMTHDVPTASAKLASLYNKLRTAKYAKSYTQNLSIQSNEQLLINKVFTQENMEIIDSKHIIISNIIPHVISAPPKKSKPKEKTKKPKEKTKKPKEKTKKTTAKTKKTTAKTKKKVNINTETEPILNGQSLIVQEPQISLTDNQEPQITINNTDNQTPIIQEPQITINNTDNQPPIIQEPQITLNNTDNQTPIIQEPQITLNNTDNQTPIVQEPQITLNNSTNTINPYTPTVIDSSTINELEKTLDTSQLKAFSELDQSEKIKIAKLDNKGRIDAIEKHIKSISILEPDPELEPNQSYVQDDNTNKPNDILNDDDDTNNIKAISINSNMLIAK